MATGRCYMVFHVWKELGELSVEVLESYAETGFRFFSKAEYDEGKCKGYRHEREWLDESWSESGYKEEIAEQIAEEVGIEEGEDRYFEFFADYRVTPERDYWGEYSEEEEIANDHWQEISKEQYNEES